MVGVLKALGARSWTVQKIFLSHSAIITVTGIVVGAAVGLGLLYLQQATGFIKLQEEAYYMSTAAVKIVWWQIGLVCAGTLVVCFAVLMIQCSYWKYASGSWVYYSYEGEGFDFLHPKTPARLINGVAMLGGFVENLPIVSEFAGSLYIRAIR